MNVCGPGSLSGLEAETVEKVEYARRWATLALCEPHISESGVGTHTYTRICSLRFSDAGLDGQR